MKKIIISLLLLFFSLQVYGFSINVDPPSIYTKARPGATVTSKITVENTSKNPIVLKVYIEDWQYQNDLTKKFLKLGSTPYSLADNAKLSVKELRLAGNAKENVYLDVTSPQNKNGGLYGVVFFEAAPMLVNKSSNVRLIGRIGSIIYHEIDSTQTYDFDLVVNDIEQDKTKTQIYLNFINKSNIHLKLEGSLLILGRNHVVVDRQEVSFKALPNKEQIFVVNTNKKLISGSYKGLLSLNYLGDKLFTKEISINVK